MEKFTFEYCYDSGDEDEPYEWEDEWDDEKLRVPRGVKVAAAIKNEATGKNALKFTEIIFAPTGVLGEEGVGL